MLTFMSIYRFKPAIKSVFVICYKEKLDLFIIGHDNFQETVSASSTSSSSKPKSSPFQKTNNIVKKVKMIKFKFCFMHYKKKY